VELQGRVRIDPYTAFFYGRGKPAYKESEMSTPGEGSENSGKGNEINFKKDKKEDRAC
jgi:hypothetical protein